MARTAGEVKFFNETRGFGFIKRDDGGDDVFVHITALNKAKIEDVKEGTRLTFDLDDGKDKKLRAVNLQRA